MLNNRRAFEAIVNEYRKEQEFVDSALRMSAGLRRSYPRLSLLNWLFQIGRGRTFAGRLHFWINTPRVQPPVHFVFAIWSDSRLLINAMRAGGQCGK